VNKLSKLSDKIKQAKKEQEQEEEIGIAGVWECAYCGSKIEQVIHPYLPNIPDICAKSQCVNNNLNTKRFIFIKWEILK